MKLPTWKPPTLPSVPFPSSLENLLDRYYQQFQPGDDQGAEEGDSPSARAWKWWFEGMKRCHGVIADYDVYQWFLDAVAHPHP